MKITPTVLGINLGHDGGCALLHDGQLVAIAEERLTRQRYTPGWTSSLLYCLSAAGITLAEVDHCYVSCTGPSLETSDFASLQRLGLPGDRIHAVDHHLSHAYTAHAYGGNRDAVIVIMDGAGNERATESYYLGDASGVHPIGGNSSTRSRSKGIGATYDSFTNYIGFHEQEAGKVMGLAAYGDSSAFETPLFYLNDIQVEGALDFTHERGLVDFAGRHRLNIGQPHSKDSGCGPHLAAWIQGELERVCEELTLELLRRFPAKQVCFGGGVAMNCTMNGRLRRKLSAIGVNLEVAPPSSDRGQALGNVLFGYRELQGELYNLHGSEDSFGRCYEAQEVREALCRYPRDYAIEGFPRADFTFHTESNISRSAAQLIADGNVVAWFQGGSELGARALGYRSLLSDPRQATMPQRLNSGIKKREWFRPFAPVVLHEDGSDWVEDYVSSRHMMYTERLTERAVVELPAVTHADRTARYQSAHIASPVRSVLEEFKDITNVPVLLNTSFNVQEPIVETPRDALNTFRTANIDYLVMGDYLVSKS